MAYWSDFLQIKHSSVEQHHLKLIIAVEKFATVCSNNLFLRIITVMTLLRPYSKQAYEVFLIFLMTFIPTDSTKINRPVSM